MKHSFKYLLAWHLLFAAFTGAFAQAGLTRLELDLMKANDLFDQANYVQALDQFLKIEKKLPNVTEIKRKIGTCYLNIHDDKAKALPYLLKIFNSGVYDDELLLELGQAHQFAGQFDKAIVAYSMYRERIPAKKQPVIDHYIETCENAKELVKKPVHVNFENLGKDVNTKFADYYPFVSKDESALYFTTRREDCLGNSRSAFGYFSSDVYFSTVKKGQWQKAKNMGAPINTVDDEEIVGLTPNGRNMIIYVDRKDIASDLMHAEVQRNKKFGRPLPFNEPVNTEGLELEGSYSADANTMFFAAVRKNGLGESDIYCTKKLPNGEWGIPRNLGPNVNTQYKEGFPVVSEDEQTLYFASQGHTSMGGFDIFKSHWDEEKQEWGKAINIGYPVNTPDDDMMFSLAGKGRDGYLSAWRKEGFGDLDIYRITFLDVEQPLTAVVGNVRSADSTLTTLEATIGIFDANNEEIETKDVNPQTGRYIFIVEPGKYRIEINCGGHKALKEDIIVYDKSDYSVELVQDFLLLPDK